jgi:hypothetical protein
VLAEREACVVVDVHRAEQRAVLEEQAELLAHLEELVVGHVRDRLAVDQDVARVRIEEPDDVLDQHRLAGAGRAEHHRDHVVREAEVAAVQDPRASELLDEVDDLYRVLTAVVALLAGVPLIGIRIVGVDAGDDVVAPREILLAVALRDERIALLDGLGVGRGLFGLGGLRPRRGPASDGGGAARRRAAARALAL